MEAATVGQPHRLLDGAASRPPDRRCTISRRCPPTLWAREPRGFVPRGVVGVARLKCPLFGCRNFDTGGVLPNGVRTAMSHPFTTDSPLRSDRVQELLRHLEAGHVDVKEVRARAACPVRAAVQVRPADVDRRDQQCVEGVTTEVQRSGVVCLLERPVLPGNVFHVAFDREHLQLDSQLVVCDRVAMLSDCAFDVHFRFVREVELPEDVDRG